MQYNVYTTGVDWKKKIYGLLKEILKQKEIFQSEAISVLREFDGIVGHRNSLELGEFLQHVIWFFLRRGDQIFQKLKLLPEYKYGLTEAQTKSFYILEGELIMLNQNLRELILALWALKMQETASSFQTFMDSLQSYCWDELNQLSVDLTKKQELSRVRKGVAV